ncbi:hypothetical protein DL96DRAFT_1619073 [Flagelloscypha sp. PMI_526]|nr:hypothetical protein DL96DRAFT_1619073 [Flagelloscypha sp. PMI_526]
MSDYHFTDGTLTFSIENHEFRIHEPLLSRHCRGFLSNPAIWPSVSLADIRVLLSHLYHDKPFSSQSDLDDISSILRITSPKSLDWPALHETARSALIQRFPGGPTPFTHNHPNDPIRLEAALELAEQFHLPEVSKSILYTLVQTCHFYEDEGEEIVDKSEHSPLSPTTIAKCQHLMSSIIAHFTPVLFTVGTTSHMSCTEVFADTWMPDVIQPALGDDGVYKPLETLERLKTGINWISKGLCSSCLEEKKVEWTEEQETVWKLMDSWVITPTP